MIKGLASLCLLLSAALHLLAVQWPLWSLADPKPVPVPLSISLRLAPAPPPETANAQARQVLKSEDSPPTTEPLQPETAFATVHTREHVEAASKPYWSRVADDIARHIRYPAGVRAGRHDELISIRLVVGRDGELLHVDAEGLSRSPVYRRAALNAVKAAAPFDPPPEAMHSPVTAALPVRFSARR